jgi:hypothetical protein
LVTQYTIQKECNLNAFGIGYCERLKWDEKAGNERKSAENNNSMSTPVVRR